MASQECRRLRRALMTGAGLTILATGGTFAQDLKFPIGEGGFTWDSYEEFAAANDFSGQTLTMTGSVLGPEREQFENVVDYFEEATGATVNYSGSDSFEQDIVISIQAGSPPNVAMFPQPGLVGDLAAQGALTPLGEDVAAWLAENYAAGESWVSIGSNPGPDGVTRLYAFPYKADLKSIVWYSPEAFDEMGYEIPESMEELKALTEQIVEDGGTPWCIGLGSGAATGWPATDWVEDMMLRTQPPEVYDQWVANEIPFDDPRVVEAIEEYGWFARNDDFVSGGSQAAVTEDYRDSPSGLFEFPPQCYMHRQASFIPIFFPAGSELGVDVDFFYFPAYESKDLGQPVLGAGALFAITEDAPIAHAWIEFLKTPIAHEIWMAQSGFLTPFKGANPAIYADDTLRGQGEILTNATTFRFDASDMMPGEIGTKAFWTAMVDYTTGESAEAAAAGVQTRWDSLK